MAPSNCGPRFQTPCLEKKMARLWFTSPRKKPQKGTTAIEAAIRVATDLILRAREARSKNHQTDAPQQSRKVPQEMKKCGISFGLADPSLPWHQSNWRRMRMATALMTRNARPLRTLRSRVFFSPAGGGFCGAGADASSGRGLCMMRAEFSPTRSQKGVPDDTNRMDTSVLLWIS